MSSVSGKASFCTFRQCSRGLLVSKVYFTILRVIKRDAESAMGDGGVYYYGGGGNGNDFFKVMQRFSEQAYMPGNYRIM